MIQLLKFILSLLFHKNEYIVLRPKPKEGWER